MSYKNIFGNCNSVFLQFEPSVVLTDFFFIYYNNVSLLCRKTDK